VVFYLPLSRGIEVVRVLHGSRDIESVTWAEARRQISALL